MPKVDNTPQTLRPFLFHGINLNWGEGDTEAVGDCLFCSRPGKFSVNIERGVYRCFVCGDTGNATTFLRKLWEMSDTATGIDDYEELRLDRGLLAIDTLITWGVCKSVVTKEWLVPGFGAKRNLNQLYKYVMTGGKRRLLPTPTLGHQMYGLNGSFDPDCKQVYIAEGVWDAMALWETCEGKYAVVGVPGVESMKVLEQCLPIFSGKEVGVLYHNDHDKVHPKTGKTIISAGYAGMRKASGVLVGATDNLSYLHWGEDGQTYDPKLKSGYDIRDHLCNAGDALEARLRASEEILGKMRVVPSEWLSGAARGLKTDPNGLMLKRCDKYETVVESWKNAVSWVEAWDYTFSVMLATVVSTMQLGDQLWIKVVGPPSSGKSTLCEALSANHHYVLAKSTFRGFHSGSKEKTETGEDCALIHRANGKTLVTKDGDTLMKSPNVEQILSEARDVYDTVSRTSYRNASDKDYAGVRITWILCGTSSLRSLDRSELGERFLTVIMMDGINEEFEDKILKSVASKANRITSITASNEAERQQDPSMTEVMQLTGGYINYLRENAAELLSSAQLTAEDESLCIRLGKFVAYMRARPSTVQDETHEREFAARLVSQHIRLMKCLMVVLNRSSVDEDVVSRTRRVALDSSRGVVLDMVNFLYHHGEEGCQVNNIALSTDKSDHKVRGLLKFMRKIGVVEAHRSSKAGVKGPILFRLTKKMSDLYYEVTGEEQE